MKWEWFPTGKDRLVIMAQALVVIAIGAGLFTAGWFGVTALFQWLSGT